MKAIKRERGLVEMDLEVARKAENWKSFQAKNKGNKTKRGFVSTAMRRPTAFGAEAPRPVGGVAKPDATKRKHTFAALNQIEED